MAVSQLGTPSVGSGNSTSVSLSHTVASGSNRVSYIFLQAAGDVSVTSPSFAGVTPTLMNTPGEGDMHVYRVVSPATGATSFTATLSSANRYACHIYSLQGVDTADPDDALQEQELHSDPVAPNTVVVSTATGDRAVAFGYIVGANIAPNSGSTLVNEVESIDSAYASSAVVFQDGNGTVTVGITSTDFCCDSYVIGFNVNAAGSGAAYSLTADQGSYALNGQVVGLAQATRSLTAAQGSYTLIGSDAYREIQMNVEWISYALTGQDANLVRSPVGVTLVAEFGTYTLTGADAFRDIYMVLDQGSYVMTGIDAGLSAGRRVPMDQGTYDLIGYAATLLWNGAPGPSPNRLIMRRRFFGYRLGR